MSEASHYRDWAAGRVHEDEAASPAPDRPPMDGGGGEDIGMMSTPILFEHGHEWFHDDGARQVDNTPALRMYLEVQLPPELFEVNDHALQDIQDYMETCYRPKAPGYWTEFDVQPGNEPGEVFISVEFSAGDYDGDESLDTWIERTRRYTHFNTVYNRYVIYYHGRDELLELLNNTSPRTETGAS